MSKTPDLTAQFAELTQQVTEAFRDAGRSAGLSESTKLFETFGRWMQASPLADPEQLNRMWADSLGPVSYTHLRAHETM
jgi:hypothetical protein